MTVALKPCGTYAAYERHRRAGEPACSDCMEAMRVRSRRYYRNQGRRNRKPIRHGTLPGYQRHIRRGETPCQPCRRAKRDAMRTYRRSTRRERIKIRDAIVDVLSTHDRWLARNVTVALVLDLHPEWQPMSIVRGLLRLAAAGVIDVRIVDADNGQVEHAEYRCDRDVWERL